MKMTQEKFLEIIKKIVSQETSADPENWTPENTLWGHCAVVSLLAQDYFGGDLIRGSLEDFPEYAYLRSHYWNRLPDGNEIDLTQGQFIKRPCFIHIEMRTREDTLNWPDTKRRYDLLQTRFNDVLK